MNDLADYVQTRKLFGRHGFPAMEWRCRDLTRAAPFEKGNVLEIGAGDGLLSLWMLYRGAASVVSLEPEAAGATHGVGHQAELHRTTLRIPEERWSYRADTFQGYRPDRRFRMVLSHASINHLDEPACEKLLEDREARASYRSVFEKIRDLLEPGGSFVFSDVARVNYWAMLGLKSPWAPEIEWHKHQEPETWCAMLKEVGLEPVSIRWRHPFYRAQKTLGPLLENKVAARCLGSSFVATVRKPFG